MTTYQILWIDDHWVPADDETKHAWLVRAKAFMQSELTSRQLRVEGSRFLGTFLAEPTDVPSDVVAYVAAQLGIRDVACLAQYAARPTTAWEHAAEISADLRLSRLH